ncbi:LLM class flavin-dependent oxidoreductase [Bacillus aquiflavi]|uniref:LLM class flavin-dependent oxidoreductase n=1 Tax=Bacillus aquiflavi TaxID=2672567 RepID=A0A6B3VUM8_9BACI|nr:LLM class flavin-dependent oxidoreductase [Bacillus aquiflavi]MBA4536581.1 LLM class flavin-dependent oxidoreductase [Bacillus aquiflavi]NEY80948.1 LLM class flavin-dependent oxidoreductase [Bacillus aquiflavi]UAC49662.1 LLM class flavin-dependent oxidoreductase [Bacillus aquiflavi]
MKFGFWLPIFGGWLRNVKEEHMPPTFDYAKNVIQSAEAWGFDMTLIAELYLNDIKGIEHDSLEAWSTASALAAVTEKIEILTAIRPGFHNPAVIAKMAANIDHISNGRFTLNIVSAWWEEEAKQYGGIFTKHNERYDRTEEFIEILKGLWTQQSFRYDGEFYQIENAHLEPKPIQHPYPTLYAGGESERGKQAIVNQCDAYVMHGGTVDEIALKIADMKERRANAGKEPFQQFGMAAYVICRDSEKEAQQELQRITNVKKSASGYAGFVDFTTKSKLEKQVTLMDYSVSNRGLRPNLIGTPLQIAERIHAYEKVGLDLLILQFSPQLEEMERFAKDVIPLIKEKSSVERGLRNDGKNLCHSRK